MKNKSRVEEWFAKHKKEPLCDECISNRLALSGRRAVWRVTKLLGAQPSFNREKRACPSCGNIRMVIDAQ
jgi:hypothetical protein